MKSLRVLGAVLTVVAGGFLAVYLGLRLGSSDGEKQAIAAWVQAVGSIAALGVTGWLFLAQRESERKRESDSNLARRLTAARRAQAATYWAVEAIGKGAESREIGGADSGLPFRPERWDHLRQMLERIAETTDDNATSVALLVVCRNLDEAFVTYTQFPGQYQVTEVSALYKIRDDTQRMYDRILAYQQKLEEEARSRGIGVELVAYD